jgi:hypothetical protein
VQPPDVMDKIIYTPKEVTGKQQGMVLQLRG